MRVEVQYSVKKCISTYIIKRWSVYAFSWTYISCLKRMPKKPVALVTARKPSYLESSGRKQKTKKHKKNNFSLYPEFYMF